MLLWLKNTSTDPIPSSIDPIPSTLIEENIDFWLPIICDLVNTSLKTGNINGA